MKKTLLLSVVASTMIMAGGDIAPVEPVVEAPVVAATGWDFNGEAVLYVQTRDNWGNGSLFDQGPVSATEGMSWANVGLRLGAENKDMFAGFGAGFELVGLGTLGLEKDVVSAVMQTGDGSLNSGAISQAYLTYGIGNTSLKVGRQQLPKALSPFAFSEGWSVFKNTFGAALLVNTDIPDTTLVGAYVANANNHGNLSQFRDINGNGDGVYMLTAQNKSVEGLTLTGTYYFAPDMLITEDVSVLWGDAGFKISDYSIALQGGTILTGEPGVVKDTTAFGAKVGAQFGMFDVSVAYSSVDEGTVSINNLATGVKTPLYTQMLLNQNSIKKDSDTIVARAGVTAFGGRFGVAYNYSELGATALNTTFGQGNTGAGTYQELDVTYKTKVSDSTTLFAGYAYQNDDRNIADDDTQNFVRVWARYSF